MGYNRSGHRRTQRLKRHKKHLEHLARKAAQQQQQAPPRRSNVHFPHLRHRATSVSLLVYTSLRFMNHHVATSKPHS